jgi:hypothetical protein
MGYFSAHLPYQRFRMVPEIALFPPQTDERRLLLMAFFDRKR